MYSVCLPDKSGQFKMKAFRKFIEGYTHISAADWEVIQMAFERKEFAKNEIILEEGNICRHFYFLEEGIIRFFVFNDGNDITKFFTLAPYCFTSKNSFRTRTPAQESIQALDRTIVWQTTLNHANELLELKSWGDFTRKFVHEVQSYTEQLLLENKTETAEQRYGKLLVKHPDIIQKIPLKHLSTFLGIAPQSLSRIRKKHQ
jgi:CRP-like cAMP-binding protein